MTPTPPSRTIFRYPWEFEIAGFYCSSLKSYLRLTLECSSLSLIQLLLREIVQTWWRTGTKQAACTRSNPMMDVLSRCSVTWPRLEGAGRCSRRGWTALWISTVAGMITELDLETWAASSGWAWIRSIAWQQPARTNCVSTWRKQTATRPMHSTALLQYQLHRTSIGCVSDRTRVSLGSYSSESILDRDRVSLVSYSGESWTVLGLVSGTRVWV